jgi:CoA:oxalate CoA-transferase
LTPLDNIKVLDLTRFVAGPFCTQLLADMGAEVVKIESPDRGDETRYQGATIDGESWYFAGLNRNKKSLTLDLKKPEGKEIFRRLTREADVVVENFRPGVMRNFGFDYENLSQINPRLIYCGISGFGKDGPYAMRPAFDFIAQGLSGFMSITGFPDREPVRTGIPISDSIAGIYAAFGILAAVVARERTGRGQEVQTSLVDSLVSVLAYLSAEYFALGQVPKRFGNDHPVLCPYGTYPAADGYFNIAPSGEHMWERLAQALGLADMARDPRFKTNALRLQNREELNKRVAEVTVRKPMAEWIEYLNREGVPCGPINNVAQALEDPQIQHQKMVLTVDQPTGRVRILGFPVKLSETPAALRRPSPKLGEHTEEILSRIGFSASEMQEFKRKGAV